jgi:hypothetical protein
MDDALKEKIAAAVINGPDMTIISKPSGAGFADNIKLGKQLTSAHPGKVVIVRDETKFKPSDFCEKYADLLVNPVNRTLNDSRLKMKVQEFLDLLSQSYGPRYKVTDDWFGQQRKVISKPNAKGLTISKVVARLRTHGIEVPTIDTAAMSFNGMRKHLQGRGTNQEFTMKLDALVVLGRSRIVINRRVFQWVNILGQECFVDTAAAMRNVGGQDSSVVSFDVLEMLLGIDRQEIVRRCNTAPL